MELTKEQVRDVDGYLWSFGIKYYDVRAEIIAHFASKLEERLDEYSALNFKQEIVKIHLEFDENGFKYFLEQKKKSVKKKFDVLTLKHLKTFFKLSKIIISVALFCILVYLMNLHDDPKSFFSIVNGFFLFVVIQFAVRMKLSPHYS